MNDEQLRKEIEETLAVEPSPQFLARVRRQIESESRRSRIGLPWKALAASLATGMVLLGVFLFEPPFERSSDVLTSTTTTVWVPGPVPERSEPPLLPTVAARPVVSRAPEPRVVIDPRETAALQSFLEDVQEKRIDLAGLGKLFESAERAVRTTSTGPAAIAEVEPIVVKPLSAAALSEGENL